MYCGPARTLSVTKNTANTQTQTDRELLIGTVGRLPSTTASITQMVRVAGRGLIYIMAPIQAASPYRAQLYHLTSSRSANRVLLDWPFQPR